MQCYPVRSAILCILGESVLQIVGTLAVLIALAYIPLSYCALALHVSACLLVNSKLAGRAFMEGRWGITYDGAIVAVLTFLVKLSIVAFLLL